MLMLPRLCFCLLLLSTCVSLAAESDDRREAVSLDLENLFGTTARISLLGKDEQAVVDARKALLTQAARWDGILSTWSATSEMSKLLAQPTGTAQRASLDLLKFLQTTAGWMTKSGGYVDPRISAEADRSSLPWSVDLIDLTVTFTQTDLSFDAIAKGYIIDQLVSVGRRLPGIDGGMILIGGDGRCWGASSSEGASIWPVAVRDPTATADNAAALATVLLTDGQAVATSGRQHRGDHLVDPLTGTRATHVRAATVVADRAASADALATQLAVQPRARTTAMLGEWEDGAALVLFADDTSATSIGWQDIIDAPDTGSAAAPVPTGPAWPTDHQVTIELQLARGSPKAYVAVWIEDQDQRLVRLLTIWGDEYAYTMKRWQRHARKHEAIVTAVTEATRRHGRHQLVWDGRNDAGQAMPQGSYRICVELNREHGKRLFRSVTLICTTKPTKERFRPGDNLDSGWVRFGVGDDGP